MREGGRGLPWARVAPEPGCQASWWGCRRPGQRTPDSWGCQWATPGRAADRAHPFSPRWPGPGRRSFPSEGARTAWEQEPLRLPVDQKLGAFRVRAGQFLLKETVTRAQPRGRPGPRDVRNCRCPAEGGGTGRAAGEGGCLCHGGNRNRVLLLSPPARTTGSSKHLGVPRR